MLEVIFFTVELLGADELGFDVGVLELFGFDDDALLLPGVEEDEGFELLLGLDVGPGVIALDVDVLSSCLLFSLF